MDERLSRLIFWPDRDSLQKTMPQCFQESFGNELNEFFEFEYLSKNDYMSGLSYIVSFLFFFDVKNSGSFRQSGQYHLPRGALVIFKHFI